jgi:hypothetical protein
MNQLISLCSKNRLGNVLILSSGDVHHFDSQHSDFDQVSLDHCVTVTNHPIETKFIMF